MRGGTVMILKEKGGSSLEGREEGRDFSRELESSLSFPTNLGPRLLFFEGRPSSC